MAFNKIELTKVGTSTVNTVTTEFNETFTSHDSGFDIFYHLGSNLDPVENAWSNPITAGTYVSVTSTHVPTDDGHAGLVSRNTNNARFDLSLADDPETITYEFLTGFEVNLREVRYRSDNNVATNITRLEVYLSADDVTYKRVVIDTNVPTTSDTWHRYTLLNNEDDWVKYVRFIVRNNQNAVMRVGEFELYGKLRNLTTGTAGFKRAGDRFENLLNVDAASTLGQRVIHYDETANIWESKVLFPYDVDSRVLSEDLYIESPDIRSPRYFVLSPNGANRNVFLPIPTVDDTIKFRTLDGGFDINIREPDVTNLQFGLTNYYTLNETGSTFTDSAGSFNITEFGGTIGSQSGLIGNEITLNGANAWAHQNNWVTAGSVTLSIWATLDNGSSKQAIVTKWEESGGTVKNFRLYTSGGRFRWQVALDGIGPGVEIVDPSTYSTGTRYHLVATYDEATGDQKLYVDGVEVATYTHPGGGPIIDSVAAELQLGAMRNASASLTYYMDGALDEFGIWDRALLENQVLELYNSGSGVSYATMTATPPTPVVLNNAGKLQYEYVYDGTEWHLLG